MPKSGRSPRQPDRGGQRNEKTASFSLPKLTARQTHAVAVGVILVSVLIFLSPQIEHGSFQPADSVAYEGANNVLRQWYLECDTTPDWAWFLGPLMLHPECTPLWSPGLFSGMPSYGSLMYSRGEMINSLLYEVANKGLRFVVILFLGAIALYAFLRRRQLGATAAVIGTLVFVCTPYFTGLFSAGHYTKIWGAAYIPALLLGCDLLWERKNFVAFAVASFFFGGQLGVNHPQVTYYTYMLIAVWWLSRTVIHVRGDRGYKAPIVEAGLTLGVVAVGLALVALPYLPLWEYTSYSVRGAPSVLESVGASGGVKGATWSFATQWSFHPKELISFAMPSFYGLMGQSYWGFMRFTQSTHYLGIVPLVLALFIRRPWSPLIWACLTFSGIAVVIGFGEHMPLLFWPMYHWAPYFNKFRIPSMIYMMLPLTVGILAAFGVQEITDETKRAKATSWARLLRGPLGGLALVLGMIVIWAMSVTGKTPLELMRRDLLLRSELRESLIRDYGAQLSSVLSQLYRQYSSVFRVSAEFMKETAWFAALWLAVSAGVVALRRRAVLSGSAAGLILLVATAADIWQVDWKFWQFPEKTPKEQREPTDVIRWLTTNRSVPDSTQYRLAIFDERGMSNSNAYAYFGISSVSGYHSIQLRTYKNMMESGALSRRPVLDMLNASYIVSPTPPKLGDGLELVFRGQQESVWKNSAALPRSWLVWNTRVVSDERQRLLTLRDPTFDPAHEAIVPQPIEGLADSGSGTARVTASGLHHITIETDSDAPALLVSSEVHFPAGWSATIDNEAAEIHETNYILRGVKVPAGNHRVEFTFKSRYFEAGWWISRTVALLLALVFLFSGIDTLLRLRSRRTTAVEVAMNEADG